MNTNVRDNANFLHDPPICVLQGTGNQSIPNTSVTEVTFSTVVVDTDSISGTANRMTFTTAGVYAITTNITWNLSASAGNRWVSITNLTTTQILAATIGPNPGAASSLFMQEELGAVVKVAAADVLHVTAWQNQGSALSLMGTTNADSIDAGSFVPKFFSAQWLGAG